MDCTVLESRKIVVIQSSDRTNYVLIPDIFNVWCELDKGEWLLVISSRLGIYRVKYNNRSTAENIALKIMTHMVQTDNKSITID